MNIKSIKIIYWFTTALLALFILPGIFFLNSPMAAEGIKHVGIPHWLHLEAGIGSFIGGLILIIPGLPSRLKEWAYVAFGILYISAFTAHLSVDGVIPMSFTPLLAFAILLISYLCYHRILRSTEP